MSLTQTNGQIREEGPLTETERMRDFKFERVYGPDATQTGVYEQSASNIVNAVLQGYNGTYRSILPFVS